MDIVANLLRDSGYAYELILHDTPLFSVQEGAAYFHIAEGQTAPTLLLKTEDGYKALVIAGDRGKINFKEIAALVNCKRVCLASRKEVEQVTGFAAGCVPMIGLSVPYILDRRLFRYDFVYGGSGQSTRTLKVEPAALQQLNRITAMLGT